MGGKDKRINNIERTKIESTQLPPTLPHGNMHRLHLRPKSNMTNMVSSQIRSRRPSKLKISLKVAVHVDDKMRYSTPQSLMTDSKNGSKLSGKTKSLMFGKRSTSKHSRKRSKTKLCFSNKRDQSRIAKNKKNMNTNISRSASIKKKRKEMNTRYNLSSDLFKSLDMKKKSELYDGNRCMSGSISKYDNSNLTLTNTCHKTSMGMHELTPSIWNSKGDCRKSLFTTTKSRQVKSRAKGKHFKLFKKRNLNSKISKELKLTDITRFSPNKSRIASKKKHPSLF